jgi:anti-anti-sigma factor
VPDTAGQPAPLLLELAGELDLARTSEIVLRGNALLRDAGAGQRMVVDLARVEFIDSSGLSGLLRLRRLATSHGVSIFLRAVPPDVAVLLRLSGIDQLLPAE